MALSLTVIGERKLIKMDGVQIDLCSNCVHEKQCSYRFNSLLKMNNCEEHSILIQEKRDFEEEVLVSNFRNPELAGLCVNCDFSDTCTIREKNSIIVNCEQYK